MKITRKLIVILLCCTLPAFSGCEQLLDCTFSVSPKLSDNDLPTGKTGQNYSATITGEARNDPNDDNYDYTYHVSGTIPEGIGYTINGRDIHFMGTPLKAGISTFKVDLSISNYIGGNAEDERCILDHNTSRTYKIIVNN